MIKMLREHRSRRIAVGCTLIGGCIAAVLATPAAAGIENVGGADVSELYGVVGPDDDISISARSVPAGPYRIIVRDRSDDHNFHMKHMDDPSLFNEKTRVEQEKKVVWEAVLAPGRYRIHCDPHRDDMKTFLTVT